MKPPATLPSITLCVALSLIGVARCDGQQAAASATDSAPRAAAQPAEDATQDSPCAKAKAGAQDKGSTRASASPAAEESVCLLVSGDLSRLRDGRDVVAPVGGLGDGKTKGVLHEMLSLESQSTVPTLRLLTGNNLGRAIKAGTLATASSGLAEQPPPREVGFVPPALMVRSIRSEIKIPGYEKRIKQLEASYANEGLSLEALEC